MYGSVNNKLVNSRKKNQKRLRSSKKLVKKAVLNMHNKSGKGGKEGKYGENNLYRYQIELEERKQKVCNFFPEIKIGMGRKK